MKLAVAGTGYVGLSIATLLSQNHEVMAVDIIPEKVEKINKRISPIQDEYIEKYLKEKELNLTATLDAELAYKDADFVVIAAPTNYDSKKNFFDTSAVEAVIKLVIEYNPDAIMVIKSTIPPMYTEGYEGFYHLDMMRGSVEEALMDYIIRDHDREKFEQKKKQFLLTADFLNQKYGPGTVEAEIKDSYYNMKEKIEPHMHLIDLAIEAMEELSIQPKICPIRGGTDDASLSYMVLPCPNLCTGGHNFHGKYEYICIQSMEKVTELLILLVQKFEQLLQKEENNG